MLRTDELVFAALFVLVVAAVLAAAAWECLRLARERWFRAERPKAALRRWWRRGVLSAAGLGVVCIAWGYFVEPYWPEVTRTRIESAAIPKGSGFVRIVLLSDLHCDPIPRIEDRLPALVAAEKPDLIAFTGDAVNSPGGLPVFRRTMTALARIAPTFVVYGNWDVWYYAALDRFGGTGVVELDGTSSLLHIRGAAVRVAGIAYGHAEMTGEALAGSSRGELRLFLCHTPDDARAAIDRGADLVLAGHTHGGQVALPLLGPILTLTKSGRVLARGLHPLGSGWIYTSRGVGMEGGRAPRVRFWARPEIAVIEVGPR